ncbi:hypothetical protein NQ315_013573, partial [Exocentrus adspersus]
HFTKNEECCISYRRYINFKKITEKNGFQVPSTVIHPVYTDKTYLHSCHTQPKCWDDGQNRLKRPLSKGKRLIIVHAGGKNGFTSNGLLIFHSGSAKSGDYHDDMNHTNFSKWVESQLIPNLPPKTFLVVDNASYHNVKADKSPTSGSRKGDMINWLIEHNIQHDPKVTKLELYNIIKYHKEATITYRLDILLQQHGHTILRLPPYHPEVNPIEKIWAMVKNRVAARNVTFKLNDVEASAREEFNHSLVFTVNTGSSDEEDFESTSSDSDDGLTGIEPLV